MPTIKRAAGTASILVSLVLLTVTAACGGAQTDSDAAVTGVDDTVSAMPTEEMPLSGVAFEVHRDPG